MTEFPMPQDEAMLHALLSDMEILNSPPEQEYDQIASLAMMLAETPIAMIGFRQKDKTWFKSIVGLDVPDEYTSSVFFKDLKSPLVIIDTADDQRTASQPLILRAKIKSLAVVPLQNENGLGVGLLVVADTKARSFSSTQVKGLELLAIQVMNLLKLRQLTLNSAHRANLTINKELEKQKLFYENILNKIPTDIAVFDLNHRYIFLNPGAIKDEGLRKKIIGMDDFEYARLRGRDDTIARLRRAQFLEAKNTGQVVKWEDSVKNADGQVITVLRRIFPVNDEHGKLNLFIGFGVDITERKMLEEKQSVMMKQLSAQNTQLLDFCNIVSHNLRGPLINMAMLVEFIEESDDLEDIKILTSKLTPVIDSLNTTFNELVESIQVRQDLEVATEPILLQEYLQRTLDGLKMEINKNEAEIIVNFNEAPVVIYPPKYLNSIFHNLVSNAIKYRSPHRKPRIEISTRKTKDSIVLTVKDNGLGIDLNKHKDNIFKIGKVFHKHPNAKGLGLYMTKTQVEAMDGKIWVESSPDQGAIFYIIFTNQQ